MKFSMPTINNSLGKKPGLHPRNRHALRYDFAALTKSSPELKNFVAKNKFNDESIDFANPEAVKALNRAILKCFYGINWWDIPPNYLCPPIPGRADYIHRAADLLASSNGGIIPKGENIRLLDIGVGANCVYPLIASYEYGWTIVGSDTDANALANADKIITTNHLNPKISLRLQTNPNSIFEGIIQNDDFFDISISNPPFHSSLEEAQAKSERKNYNLNKKKQGHFAKREKNTLNFGGQNNELWCPGGEALFITRMIQESKERQNRCLWFTSLVSQATTLPVLYDVLKNVHVQDYLTIDMSQGQKKSRILAWTFFTPSQQNSWQHSCRNDSRP